MTPEDQAQLQQSIDTIAQILYRNTPAEQLQTLEGIEQAIRQQTQELVLPQLGVFLLDIFKNQKNGQDELPNP